MESQYVPLYFSIYHKNQMLGSGSVDFDVASQDEAADNINEYGILPGLRLQRETAIVTTKLCSSASSSINLPKMQRPACLRAALTLRASRALENDYPGDFDFRMYNIGDHNWQLVFEVNIINKHQKLKAGELGMGANFANEIEKLEAQPDSVIEENESDTWPIIAKDSAMLSANNTTIFCTTFLVPLERLHGRLLLGPEPAIF